MEGTKILYRLISTIEGALVSLAPRIKGVLAGLAASLGNSPTMQPMVNAINSVIAALDRIPEAARRAATTPKNFIRAQPRGEVGRR